MKTLTQPKGIVIHHSLTKDGIVADWDAIKKYHMETQGWDDIGYHAGIERVNNVIRTCTGRPINKEGGHTKGHNDMLGLCIVGNFDLAPPDDLLLHAAAIMTRAWLCMFPHLTYMDVHPHHLYAPYKSCPGTQFPWTKFIDLVRNDA